ncbi:MAG TPA: heparinase II/III family protein, partial [Saprospiraceae bacterium]|nr:heparinase II/III family protein [Saprospiraceae bacterium]
MNLLPKYILISKIVNWITVNKNCIWRYLPLKLIFGLTIKKDTKGISTNHIQKKLSWLLGWSGATLSLDLEKSIQDDILLWADQTIDHRFDILGSGIVRVDPIDWHTDFKTRFTWRKGIFYKKYIKVDLSNSADIKVVWELSRCHQLIWLGEAYLISHDEKYAKEVINQIEHWIEENPLMYSINWTCSMEVAIRAVNWIYALNMVISARCIKEDFIKKVYKSLYEHGFFIFNNFEKTFPYASNHYAANICGLLFISQFFDNLKAGNRWFDFAINEYYYEIRNEILPTGVHFERSISYHRLMVELFFYTYLMVSRTGNPVPLD